MKLFKALLPFLATIYLTSCATVSREHLTPKIELVGVEQSTGAESALEFDLQLRITNPNDTPLELSGLYYELSLEGIDVVTGTTRDVPAIEGFDSATIRVNSAPSIINGARFVAHMVNHSEDTVDYRLRVKLGTKSSWVPGKVIEKEGQIPLK